METAPTNDINRVNDAADDIDIEEHDILDHPTIKNVFPDISALKKELEESFKYDDSSLIPEFPLEQIQEKKSQDTIHETKEDLIYKNSTTLCENNVYYEQFFEDTIKIRSAHVQLDDLGSYLKRSERYCGICNILFSSRSNYEDHNIASHLQDCLQNCIAALFEGELELPFGTPLGTDNEKEYVSLSKQIETAFVDKKHLQCKDCAKVFKTVAHLNFHCKIKKCFVHLTPKTTDLTDKLTNIINLREGDEENGTQKMCYPRTRMCSHCNTIFPTEEDLIDHMYSLLQTNENMPPYVDQDSSTDYSMIATVPKTKEINNLNKQSLSIQNKSIKHYFNNVQNNKKNNSTKCHNGRTKGVTKSITKYQAMNERRKIVTTNMTVDCPPKNNIKAKEGGKQLYYRCPVCASYFVSYKYLMAHLQNNNVLKEPTTLKKVPFHPQCPYCKAILKNFKSYQAHVFTHRKGLHQNYQVLNNCATKNSDEKQKVTATNKCSQKFKSNDNEKLTRVQTKTISKKKLRSHASSSRIIKMRKLLNREKNIDSIRSSKMSDHFYATNITAERSTDKQAYNLKSTEKSVVVNSPYKTIKDSEVGTENTFKTPTNFILNSTLFKCNKCDIHFVSAKTAVNHHDHVELLINWKCSKCNLIFKKEDEEFHEKQHNVSDDYGVYDLNVNRDTDLSELLYKCANCAVHSDHFNFLNHFLNCGRKQQDSVYCKHCDILIDILINESHEASHKNKVFFFETNWIIVEAEILTSPEVGDISNKSSQATKRKSTYYPNVNKATKKNKYEILTSPEVGDRSNKSSQATKRKPTCYPNVHKTKKKKKFDYLLNMCYCDTCQCFLTECLKKNVHIESRCSHLNKKICKICGLVFTPRTYQSHKFMHERMKDLQLIHFKFHDLRSGESICPPIPTYPKCSHCGVHFISKRAHNRHECSENLFLTCHICDKIFSEHAFKLHMAFHQYHDLSLLTPTDINKIQRIDENNQVICSDEDSITDIAQKEIVENLNYKNTLNIEDLSRTKTSLTSNGKYSAIHDETQTLPTFNNDILNSYTIPISKSVPFLLQEIDQTKCKSAELTLFKCHICQITVDTYDKVVQHCQWHYSRQKKPITTKTCGVCAKDFENSCFNDHQKWHLSHPESATRLLQFDVTYFKSRNEIWINHLLGSLSKDQINQIIGNSIYKFEHRIKLEVLQHGESDFTVYKCEKCQCYIDELSLYRHSENSCFKLRQHPCSFCGLPFIASLTKLNHEKIHENREMPLKSFRVVVFNRKSDEHLNNVLKSRYRYTLYQCRNCNSVLSDICQWDSHKCTQDLKPCQKCGLLFESSDFNSHSSKHLDLHDFVESNLKVILCGNKVDRNNDSFNKSEYKGLIKDYTFYQCRECQMSFQAIHRLEEHICSYGANRFKCPDCDLYFPSSNLKSHRRLHDADDDFIKENLHIIISAPKNVGGTDIIINQH